MEKVGKRNAMLRKLKRALQKCFFYLDQGLKKCIHKMIKATDDIQK